MRVVEVDDYRLASNGFMNYSTRDDYEDRLELRRQYENRSHDGYRSLHYEEQRADAQSYIRDGIRNRIEQLNHMARGWYSGSMINRLDTIEDFMNSNVQSQRYIMANPRVRQLRRDMLCNGFYDTYDDEDPNARTPEDHIDYRRAMDGVVVFGKDDEARVRHYSSTDDEEPSLTALTRHIIQMNWGRANYFLDQKIDPTNRTGGKIGG